MMGGIVNEHGMTVFAWSNDHLPPHVHVRAADWEMSVLIGTDVAFYKVIGGAPNGKQVRAAIALVEKNLTACVEEWRRIHA